MSITITSMQIKHAVSTYVYLHGGDNANKGERHNQNKMRQCSEEVFVHLNKSDTEGEERKAKGMYGIRFSATKAELEEK